MMIENVGGYYCHFVLLFWSMFLGFFELVKYEKQNKLVAYGEVVTRLF